jgi:hypothetical protein
MVDIFVAKSELSVLEEGLGCFSRKTECAHDEGLGFVTKSALCALVEAGNTFSRNATSGPFQG